MNVRALKTEQRSDLAVARDIRSALIPAENRIDESLIAGAELLQRTLRGRLELQMASEMVHEAVLSAIESLRAMGEARTHSVKCHRHLTKSRDVLELRAEDVGCTIGKFPTSGALRTEPVERG